MTIEDLISYFNEHNYSTYERNNYDLFLFHAKFEFPIKSIHITGTNGKGSTANYIYNIYRKEGYKVGLYQSPYFFSPTEMISVDGKNISDEEYVSLFSEFKSQFEKYNLSSFEMQTYIAYQYFLRNNLDLVIVEVGMGGFIDATNIITPVLSIITSVSLEHTAYLGRSISEIAYNKAGIIKENVPVLLGKLEDSALYAIREYASDMNSEIIIVDDYHNEIIDNNQINFDYRPYKNLILKTNAVYQCKNASLAIEATKILREVLSVKEDSVRQGLKENTLPGRFEYLSENLLIDGGHNPEAISNLCEALEKTVNKPVHVIFASFRDKNIETELITLGGISSDITLTTFNHPRARDEMDYFLYIGDYQFDGDYKHAIKAKLEEFPEDLVLVCGSLAFVGLVRKEFKK